MAYRCLFKASLEKVYTSHYYYKKKKKKVGCVKFSGLAALWVSLGFGSVLCHQCLVTYPAILPGWFYLSAKVGGGGCFCSRSTHLGVVPMEFTCFTMWTKHSYRLVPSTPLLNWFLQHPMTQRHP